MPTPDELFFSMLKEREQVIAALLGDLQSCAENAAAFDKLVALHDKGAPVDTDRVIRACAKTLRHLNAANQRMLMLLLCYSSGRNFQTDTVEVLSKMGRGSEALREVFKQKLAGK